MTEEKIERIKKLESLLTLWEERWHQNKKQGNAAECNRILKKEIDPLRKQLQREMGGTVTMRDKLKIGGMTDYDVSSISNEFIKMLMAVDYIADVSESIKDKLKKCGIGSTDVNDAVDKVARAAQEIGDKAVGHKKLRDTPIAMLLSNNEDFLEQLDVMLEKYICDSLDMYHKIIDEEQKE